MAEQKLRNIGMPSSRFVDQRLNITVNRIVVFRDTTWAFCFPMPAQINADDCDVIRNQMFSQFLIPSTVFSKAMHKADSRNRFFGKPVAAFKGKLV